MTTKRRSSGTHTVDGVIVNDWQAYRAEKGPRGFPLCRWCREEVPSKRRTFCGPACVHEWRIRTDPGYVREAVFKRDQGICAGCSMDTEAKRKEVRDLPWDERNRWSRENNQSWLDSFWQADHIVEVVNGGGECGLENYQTLCTWCHRKKTAALARNRAIKARLEQYRNRQDGQMAMFLEVNSG